uniref:Uncharacterized protein n=1 Tax=Timema shepardi TaxID=629360 RepID=A0A7R9ANS5_TIMSH|nr:unnamed protein product [Timema shepardi]
MTDTPWFMSRLVHHRPDPQEENMDDVLTSTPAMEYVLENQDDDDTVSMVFTEDSTQLYIRILNHVTVPINEKVGSNDQLNSSK